VHLQFHHLGDGPLIALPRLNGRSERLGRKEQSMSSTLLAPTQVGIQAKLKTMIVTGASQGIGAGVTKAFINRGFNVVANSRNFKKGNIADASIAAKIAAAAHDFERLVEYAQEGIRFNGRSKISAMRDSPSRNSLEPLASNCVSTTPRDVLHMDAGAHNGKW